MINTIQVQFELPRTVFSALKQDPDTFVKEMRLAAAVKWYETEQVSQEKAAQIAGISRSEFLSALARFNVTPFQLSLEELLQETQDV